MQVICATTNIRSAYKRVKQNKGVVGIDQMAVGDFADWFKDENLVKSLQLGTYQPMSVKLVAIPKPNGGTRMLGIPTVRDRVIQQAIVQVLFQIYDPIFSDHKLRISRKTQCLSSLEESQ
jgi:retron-type reverse transcriptase